MREPFDHAVARHGPTVLRVCRAVLGPGSDADDAWSETFLAALAAWPGLKVTNLEAWLVRVAHRKAIDITRARAREAAPAGGDTDLDQIAGTGGAGAGHTRAADPGQRLEDAELWTGVAALPERQRLAIAYHYLGGLTHVETSELIGSTPEAVRRAASDGMKSLRRTHGATTAEPGVPPSRTENPDA